MKLPFSYRNNVFSSVLFASFLGHLVFLGNTGFLVSSPHFAVEQAPTSLEVVILKETEPKKELAPNARVLSLKEPSPQAPEVLQRKRDDHPERQIQKSIVSPPQKGALQEADPVALKNPAPPYPLLAKENGWQGLVVLKVLVDPSGRPSRVQVFKSSGYKILDQSALRTVERWRFLPARVGHWSFSSWIKIPVRFVLLDAE